MEEYQAEENYWGYEDSYLDGKGYRKKGTRPMAVAVKEISKSVLTNLDKDEEEELKKKRGITELQDIDVEEVSYVDVPATRQKFMIIKGDDKEMITLKPKELETVRETISILNNYELTGELLRAKEVLISNFGTLPGRYPHPVKKYDKVEWETVQNQLYGYCEDDLDFIEENIEVEKRDPNDKWPSLSTQFELNRRRLEKAYEEYELESRAV